MIVSGSRYEGQPVVTVPTSLTTSNVAVFGPAPVMSAGFLYYTVRDGDRLDLIANKLYGIPDYWWRIADANPEVFYPDDLVTGSIIRIPTS